MYVIGITAAILITQRRWKARAGAPALVGEVAIWGVPAGIIGGRIYFDLTTPRYIPHHLYGSSRSGTAAWASGGRSRWPPWSADLPVRADLRPGAGRRPGLAGPSPQRQAAGPVRAVRHRVLGFPDLRGSAARRPLRALPRAAAEHVRRQRRGPGRCSVVLEDAAPAPRRTPRACRGTRRAARGSEPGPAIASQPGSQHRWPGLPVKVPGGPGHGRWPFRSAGPGAAGCALYPWGYSGGAGQGSPAGCRRGCRPGRRGSHERSRRRGKLAGGT